RDPARRSRFDLHAVAVDDRRLLLALGGPELPDAVLGAVHEVALAGELAVLVVVAPAALRQAVLVLALGGELAALVKLLVRAVPHPAAAVGREVAAEAELHRPRRVANLGGLHLPRLAHAHPPALS